MKRIALMSDIHGNYKALEAFLKYIESNPVDGIICLGDYVTDAPYPQRLMSLLYTMKEQYPCYLLRGNREEYLLENLGNCKGWKPSSANGILLYTLQQLTEKDLNFFASLPTERILQLEGGPELYICHGTPGRVRGNVDTEPDLREKALCGLPCRYLLGGHSHHQELYEYGEKTYINPGSLGLAIDGVGRRAQFAILTLSCGNCRAELLSVSYDVEAFLRDYGESGVDRLGMTLNKAVKKTLVTGINYFYLCIQAMEAEAAKAGKTSISEMPEECWQKLEERFGL
ncbi:MAG: metallophosphoesterase family protein [Acetatifactor sp.]